ncbi:MAG: hypothetical protein LM564_01425 [Desulfurococcaceae archaeon]|jgi:hypothetical protein|nr:hypothetical protein [Desulfurococcaceae archaeon]
MSWSSELYVAALKGDVSYSRSLELDVIRNYLEIRRLNKSYDDYVKPSLLYFTEDVDELAKELNVNRIVPMGLYVRGVYGGGVKEKEKYAGLVLEKYSLEGEFFKFRLINTKDSLVVPIKLLRVYRVNVYKMLYVRELNPFMIRGSINIILSEGCAEQLKKFLREALKLNERDISAEETYKRVEKLIIELQQPSNITPLDLDKYYVMYRRIRAFTASVFKPISKDFIVYDDIGYIECLDEAIAYYYTAVLNYLAFKVVELKRSFNKPQYARPVLAIYIAGLSWKNIDDSTRSKVVELSKVLHKKAPNKEYPNQKVALKDIAGIPEFKELVKLLDFKVSKEALEVALDMVSGKGVKEEED